MPTVLKATSADRVPPEIEPVSNDASSAVAVWVTLSPLVYVTESPTATLTVCGANAKPTIFTA